MTERRVGAETEAREVRPRSARAPALKQSSHRRRRAGIEVEVRRPCRLVRQVTGCRHVRAVGCRRRGQVHVGGAGVAVLATFREQLDRLLVDCTVARRAAAAEPPVGPVREVPERDRRRRVRVGVSREAGRPRIDRKPARRIQLPLLELTDRSLEVGNDLGRRPTLRGSARVQDTERLDLSPELVRVGLVQSFRVRAATVRLDPRGDRLLGREADRDHQADVVAFQHVVEQLATMASDRRPGILSELRKQPVVLAEDRVDERVQEQIRARDTEVVQDVLHASAGPAGERAMRQRFVLSALLSDDQHTHRVVLQPPSVEHRPEVPAELLVAGDRDSDGPIVRCGGEQSRPAAVLRRTRIELPRVAAPVCELVSHA